jgi:Tfp pilus assembly protein PilZ
MTKNNSRNRHFNYMDGRIYGRKRFYEILPTAACKTRDCAFIAPVCDISSNGVFIRTTRQFSVGQEVAMTITFPSTGESHMVTGEIVRVSSDGVGVNFKVFFKD